MEEITDEIRAEVAEKAVLNPIKAESIFQLVIVACLRHKQLNGGAEPRIKVPSKNTKKTKIAIDEVNQGLVIYYSKDQV